MNPETYIRKELEKNMVKGQCRARNRQRKIVADTLQAYKRNQYHDIDDLLSDAHRRIKELSVIGKGTTVSRFAMMMKVSRTTARLHLLKLDSIVRNTKKKPFIYRVGKS